MNIQPLTPAERIAGAIGAVLIGLAAALVLWLIAPPARAEGVVFDCADLAGAAGQIADFRDVGGDLDKTLALLRERVKSAPAHLEVLERETRRIWKAGKRRSVVVADVYKRCRQQLGDMGMDS